MRIFDCYDFNIIDKVKFKDTAAYIENMLSELSVNYTDIGFRLYCGPVKKALTKYPEVKKYFCLENKDAPLAQAYSNENLTSFSENWKNGELFIDSSDRAVVKEIFSKIPRPFNFSFSTLIFSGINWYENSDTSVSFQYSSDVRFPSETWILGNTIIMKRDFDDGNKYNNVYLTIESTAKDTPKDTSDIIKKLEPYFGKPEFFQRKCFFSPEEDKRHKELTAKHNNRLEDIFNEMIEYKNEFSYSPDEPLIKNIADRRTLKKAFKNFDFEFEPSKGMLPGSNILKFTDSHNYKYSILFDRPLHGNRFGFDINIRGYNFSVYLSQKSFLVKEEGESAGIIAKLAEYCAKVRDTVAEEIYNDFGDTPNWYWQQ